MLQKSDDRLNDDAGARLLTRREVEVVSLIREGLANKVVAGRLGVKEGTVKIHLHNIYRKLRVSNRNGLILRVIASAQTGVSPESGEK